MKSPTLFTALLIACLFFSCAEKNTVSGVKYQRYELTPKRKLLGRWKLDKVVYYDRFEDTDQNRTFEFESNNFFTVKSQANGVTESKTNLFSASEATIKLINMDNFKVYEIMEIVEFDEEQLVLKSIYPKDLQQTIYASRIKTNNYVYHEK